jgi:cytochrome c
MKSSKLVALGAACAFMVMGDAALAQGDAAAGATAFARCRACHLFDDTGRHRVGPNLAGVFGRTSGTVEDFPRYSENMLTSGIVWDDATLDSWLAAPGEIVAGTTMKMIIGDETMRANIIAFLKAGI